MLDRSYSPALALLLVVACVGLVIVYHQLDVERGHSQELARQLADRTEQRDGLVKQIQTLNAELTTASTRLADLRQRGLKIYTFEAEVVFSSVTALERRPLNLAAVVTLTTGGGARSYRLTNPDLVAELEGDRLRMVFEPEDPSALIGREISTLADVDSLHMNVAGLFKLAGLQLGDAAQMLFTLKVNGIPVVVSTSTGASLAQAGPVSIPVGNLFAGVEGRYAAAIGLTAAGAAR